MSASTQHKETEEIDNRHIQKTKKLRLGLGDVENREIIYSVGMKYFVLRNFKHDIRFFFKETVQLVIKFTVNSELLLRKHFDH